MNRNKKDNILPLQKGINYGLKTYFKPHIPLYLITFLVALLLLFTYCYLDRIPKVLSNGETIQENRFINPTNNGTFQFEDDSSRISTTFKDSSFEHSEIDCLSEEAILALLPKYNIKNDTLANMVQFAVQGYISIEIPVHVNILYHPSDAYGTGSNVSDQDVRDMIDDVNKSLRDEFDPEYGENPYIKLYFPPKNTEEFAYKINRHSTASFSTVNLSDYTTDEEMKLTYPGLDPTKYLNIWIVKEICHGSYCGTKGYSYPPKAHGSPVDGIVLSSSEINAFDDGFKVLTHELGHYLGLPYTHQCDSGDTCSTEGDHVCDTFASNNQTDCQSNYVLNYNGRYYSADNFMDNGMRSCLVRSNNSSRNKFSLFGPITSVKSIVNDIKDIGGADSIITYTNNDPNSRNRVLLPDTRSVPSLSDFGPIENNSSNNHYFQTDMRENSNLIDYFIIYTLCICLLIASYFSLKILYDSKKKGDLT